MEEFNTLNDVFDKVRDEEQECLISRRAANIVSKKSGIPADELLGAAYEGLVHAKTNRRTEYTPHQFEAYVLTCAIGYANNEAKLRHQTLSTCTDTGWNTANDDWYSNSYQIADALNRLGLQPKTTQIVALLLQGYTQQEIAEKLGTTQGNISKKLRKLGNDLSLLHTYKL